MKKLIALLLAALMIFGVLAGCASETAPSGDTAADSSDTADTTTENPPTTTEDGIPVITWYQVGAGQPKDIEAWNEIVNPTWRRRSASTSICRLWTGAPGATGAPCWCRPMRTTTLSSLT